MQSNILLTRGILPKVQSTRGTPRSHDKQGHVKHGKNSNSKERTPWITLHILGIKSIPFNLNVEAYDKVISRDISFMTWQPGASFVTKHWAIGYQIRKVNNSKVKGGEPLKVKGVENLKRQKAWSNSKEPNWGKANNKRERHSRTLQPRSNISPNYDPKK